MAVLAPFLLLILVSSGFLLSVGKLSQPTGPEKKRAMTGLVLFGVAMLYFTTVNWWETRRDPRPEITGRLQELSFYHTNRSEGSNFTVVVSHGAPVRLGSSYTGDRLNGEPMVRVRYLGFDHTVLSLKVLDGPAAGWELVQSEDSWWLTALGYALAMFAFVGAYCMYRRPPAPDQMSSLLQSQIQARQLRRARKGSGGGRVKRAH